MGHATFTNTGAIGRPHATREDRKFRPDIEGLRAIAVIVVLLEHAGLAVVSGGYIGVDVFFVLSGFLITGVLMREIAKTGRISFTEFYARRARRLLPASTLVLVLTVIGSYAYLGFARGNDVAEDAKWSALFAANLRFIDQGTDYLGAQEPPSPLQHFWSLAVEEQFYFVWPALVLLLAVVAKRVSLRLKLGVALSVIIAGSLGWSIYQTEHNAAIAYFSPFTRAWEMAAGGLLIVAAPFLLRLNRAIGPVVSWVGLAMVLLSVFLFDATTPFPGSAVTMPVIGASLVIAGGTIAPGRGPERILKTSPFQWVGKISYSLYLWHWPLLMITPGIAGRELSLAENMGVLLVSVVLSWITYTVLENPVRGSDILKRATPFASVALGAVLVISSFSVSAGYIERFREPAAVPMEQVQLEEYPDVNEVLLAVKESEDVTDWPEQPARIENEAYSDECDVTRLDTTSSMCEFGNPDAPRTVVLFGDSHAAMWIPSFDQVGDAANWRVVQLTKPGCIAPDFPNYSNALGREYTECAEYRQFALEQIEDIQPDMVIVTSARKGVILSQNGEPTKDAGAIEQAWSEGLNRTLGTIRPNTDRLVVLGDIAYANEPGLDCLAANPNNADTCSVPFDEAVLADHNKMEAEIAVANDAEYVDLIPLFCTDSTCPAVIGGLTTRRDALHVNENYALWLSQALGEETGLLSRPIAETHRDRQEGVMVHAAASDDGRTTGRSAVRIRRP
jgi:peptidoglycan/LPS O-acetylase OafA/YrhL